MPFSCPEESERNIYARQISTRFCGRWTDLPYLPNFYRQNPNHTRPNLVTLVGIGVLLSAFNVSDAVVEAVGAGITTPIIGFGITLANGVKQAIAEKGALGILSGGLTATSAGIAAVIIFAFLAAVLSKPREK